MSECHSCLRTATVTHQKTSNKGLAQSHKRNFSYKQPLVKDEAGGLTSFLSITLAPLDPTRHNICSKYSLILAVHSG